MAQREEGRRPRRSLMASVAEWYVRRTNPGHYDSAEAAEAYMKLRARTEDDPVPLDVRRCGKKASMQERCGMQTVFFGDEAEYEVTVLYLHGGAWVNGAHPRNLTLCRTMGEKGRARIALPLYPLAPNHTYEEAYERITALYREMLAKKRGPIVLMGDSAGATISLVLAQKWRDAGLEMPGYLVAISPCVDLSMTLSDYGPYEAADPLLRRAGIVTYAKAWAGDRDLKDPLISPYYGNYDGFPETILTAGTREIFFPDVIRFYKKMKAEGVNVHLEIGRGLNHDYPGYPIPEAKATMKKIIRAVGRRMKEKMREDQAALSRAGNGPGGTGSEGNGSGETGAGGTGA